LFCAPPPVADEEIFEYRVPFPALEGAIARHARDLGKFVGRMRIDPDDLVSGITLGTRAKGGVGHCHIPVWILSHPRNV
jgi:hypothetical protein